MAIRKSAMHLVCKMLAMATSDLMRDVLDASPDQSFLKSPSQNDRDIDVGVSSSCGPASPRGREEAVGDGCWPSPGDAREVLTTPQSRERPNGLDRIRLRSRNLGRVRCLFCLIVEVKPCKC